MTMHEHPTPPAEWDPALDGVVAAPNSHRVIFEDDNLRAMLVELEPGAKEPPHHHARSSQFIVFSSTPLLYYEADGTSFFIPEREVSTSDPYCEELPPEPLHAVENLSPDKTYRAWRIEYKS